MKKMLVKLALDQGLMDTPNGVKTLRKRSAHASARAAAAVDHMEFIQKRRARRKASRAERRRSVNARKVDFAGIAQLAVDVNKASRKDRKSGKKAFSPRRTGMRDSDRKRALSGHGRDMLDAAMSGDAHFFEDMVDQGLIQSTHNVAPRGAPPSMPPPSGPPPSAKPPPPPPPPAGFM